jgi:hypothetical protein
MMRFTHRKTTARHASAQPTTQLQRWQAVASIVGSLAVPVVIAIAGYFIQKQLANEGLRKDYVQIAVTVLNQEPAKQESELRLWAIAVLEANSPIPFTSAVRDGLRNSPLSFKFDSGASIQTNCSNLLPPDGADEETKRRGNDATAKCLVQALQLIPRGLKVVP